MWIDQACAIVSNSHPYSFIIKKSLFKYKPKNEMDSLWPLIPQNDFLTPFFGSQNLFLVIQYALFIENELVKLFSHTKRSILASGWGGGILTILLMQSSESHTLKRSRFHDPFFVTISLSWQLDIIFSRERICLISDPKCGIHDSF